MVELRIYSETLPYEVVTRAETLALLARYRLELVLAVRPWQVRELPAVARTLAEAGISLSVWPMLGDDEGRWASARNASAFAELVRDVVSALEARKALPREVLFDLEPPFADARVLTHGARGLARIASGARRRIASRAAFLGSAIALGEVVSELHARGVATSAAVWPLVALDPPGGAGWQALLGTPVDALSTGRVSVMLYTSILEGWSRGLVRRSDAALLLSAAAARATRRWGDAAGISLGCVGTGAFEDEPVYRTPRELAEDAQLARAAGCTDLTLFDLAGVLARGPAEAWLDAFTTASDARALPAPSRRIEAARRLARAATRALR
jgi:hypothetical protein